jgi:hypothetical protein
MFLVVGILIVCHALWCISSGTIYRGGSESGRVGGNQRTPISRSETPGLFWVVVGLQIGVGILFMVAQIPHFLHKYRPH